MSKPKYNLWWIILIVLLVFIILIESKSSNIETDEDVLEKRKNQEEKLLKEIEELKTKHEIFEKHKFILKFTNDYLENTSEKRYNQFIRLSLIIFLLVSSTIVFFVPAITFLNLISWYGIAVVIFEIISTIIFAKISKSKNEIKKFIKDLVDKRIYKNRSTKYFNEKIAYYETELQVMKSLINQKQASLIQLKEM